MSGHGSSDSSPSKSSQSCSESEQTAAETPQKGKLSTYEKQRLNRIEENRARMEALGLRRIATSLLGSLPMAQNRISGKKGKTKVGAEEEDDEYKPSDGEESLSSSGEEEDDRTGFSKSVLNKSKNKHSNPKNRALNTQPPRDSDFVDDDDALMQAIALSLQDSAGFLDVNKTPAKSDGVHIVDGKSRVKNMDSNTVEGKGKRKRKQTIRSRVQMTEDEFVLHFFQFDGKGSIGLRDLERVAASHDFLWSEEELRDMIHCFDGGGDGKLSLDDFRKIVLRCNMIQES